MPDRGGVLYYTINNRKAADSQPRSAQTNISCRKFYPLNRFILHENSPGKDKKSRERKDLVSPNRHYGEKHH